MDASSGTKVAESTDSLKVVLMARSPLSYILQLHPAAVNYWGCFTVRSRILKTVCDFNSPVVFESTESTYGGGDDLVCIIR